VLLLNKYIQEEELKGDNEARKLQNVNRQLGKTFSFFMGSRYDYGMNFMKLFFDSINPRYYKNYWKKKKDHYENH
jgi:hypothetical protein